MQMKRLLVACLSFLCLIVVPFAVQAATITLFTLDRDVYQQGETGYVTVTIYNDKEDTIRTTELSGTINYYYTDGNVYVQKFQTNATLPVETQQGASITLYILFSLPTNIAPGYAKVDVKAMTEIWNLQSDRWLESEHPTYQLELFIESPYKEQLEEQLTINEQLQEQLDDSAANNEQLQEQNEQLQEQLEEQLTINKNTANMMYVFGITTLVFAAVAAILFILYRRIRFLTKPLA